MTERKRLKGVKNMLESYTVELDGSVDHDDQHHQEKISNSNVDIDVSGSRQKSKIPAFSKSPVLKQCYAEVLDAAANSVEWRFNISDISHELPRGQIAKSLHELEQYIRESLTVHIELGTYENIGVIIEKLVTYVMNLLLEAEWLCLSKGFSSTCTAVLRAIDTNTISQVVSQWIKQAGLVNSRETIHRRISDIHALANCDDILKVMSDDAIMAVVRMLKKVGLETHTHIEDSTVLFSSDAVSYHKSRIFALKTLNMLLFNKGLRQTPVSNDRSEVNEINSLLKNMIRFLCNQSADRDVLCQCGASAVGLIYAAHYAGNLKRFVRVLRTFLASHQYVQRKFEGDEGACITPEDNALKRCSFTKPVEIAELLIALPSMGYLAVVRGILTFMYCAYTKNVTDPSVTCGARERSTRFTASKPVDNQGYKDSFVIEGLSCCHSIFKISTQSCLRVDVNYATLQGVQLMMSFIVKDVFHCKTLYNCLLELPEIIFTFWTRKVRRISNLAVATWNKLMELTFALDNQNDDRVITGYKDMLVSAATNSFGGNLKLRYLALQNLLRYVGPEQLLSAQPFLIPHLMVSLSVPEIKGSATVFLTELLSNIYEKIKKVCKDSSMIMPEGINTPLLALQCLTYSEVIAIIRCRQLKISANVQGMLIPQQEVPNEQLELRSFAIAESFKNIFGKIHKDYVCELLKLSTTFTNCNFYQYLSKEEQDALNASEPYVINGYGDIFAHITRIVDQICTKVDVESGERILHLDEPFNFAESICLCNARSLNSVDFVDTVVEGKSLKGVIINDSPGAFKFNVATLDSHPHVRLFYIPFQKLKDGLLHIKSDICLNVLKAIACSPKTKQPVDTLEMELMLFAIHHCMKTSTPSYRQHFVAAIKPFIRRLILIVTGNPKLLLKTLSEGFDIVTLDPNGFTLKVKEAGEGPDSTPNEQQIVMKHCAYMSLLLKMLGSTVNPCTSDFRNTTALELIYLTFQMITEEGESVEQMLQILAHDVILSMFMALFYISTRQQDLIMKALLILPKGLLRRVITIYGGRETLSFVIKKGAASLWSVKSMPYAAGAKALTLLLRGIPSTECAKMALFEGYIEAAVAAEDEPGSTESQHEIVLYVLEYLLQQLDIVCKLLDRNLDVKHLEKASCPAGLISLISHYMDSIPVNVYAKVVNTTRFPDMFHAFYKNVKKISNHILKFVGRESDQNEKDIKGYQIDCRGHLIAKETLQDYQFTSSIDKSYLDCCVCVDRIKCFKVNLPCTPKCTVPDDSNLRPFTVLCWKTIFECCTFMCSLLQWILPQTVNGAIALESVRNDLIEDPGTNIKLFYDTFNDIGRYIIASLMSCRHFGCTDAFADLMTWLCRKLVIVGLQGLLQEWLNILLEHLKGHTVKDEQWNEIFVMLRDSHRRSEPIARSFTSILKAESDRHKPILLPFAVNTLLGLCSRLTGAVETRGRASTDLDIRIHSLNILCALFRCKELRWSNNIHAGNALCASLSNMAHPDWSVRNSAALLFSSILHHITGKDINQASTGALLDQKLMLCNNVELSNELNRVLVDIRNMTVNSSESYETLNPVPAYAALYQSSAFVFNLLIRIPLYTFPPEVAFTLTENISAILFSTNASIRVMAGKLLAKNCMDTSHTNLSGLLVKNCNMILSELGCSNRVNGILMLITECLDLIIDNGLHDIWKKEKHGPLLLNLTAGVGTMISEGKMTEVVKLVSSQPPPDMLLLTMYLVVVTANCFENVVQVIKILEKMCYIHGRSIGVETLALNLVFPQTPGNAQVIECSTVLALVSAYILGADVLKRCREIIYLGQKEILMKNDKLETMLHNFERIREDDTVKVRAAASLVDTVFLINRAKECGHYRHDVKPGQFVEFCNFLLRILSFNQGRQRVIYAAMDSIVHLLQSHRVFLCTMSELAIFWHLGMEIMSNNPQFFVCTVVIRLFSAIGMQILRGKVARNDLFDEIWAEKLIGTVSERMLYNSEFFLETWKCCHIYALIRNGDTRIHTKIVALGAGLLLKAIDPGSDVNIRIAVAYFLRDLALPITDASRYRHNAIGMYVTHAVVALFVMLQDESEDIRSAATVCCSKMLKEGDRHMMPNVTAHIAMDYLLEFTIRALPPIWLPRVFEQLTMINQDIYKQVNYRLESMQQNVLKRRVYLTTSAIVHERQDEGSHLDVLAEMDTVFNVEPQNMYAETLLYVVHVDLQLCKLLRSLYDEGTSPMATADTAVTLRVFIGNSAQRIMNKLRDHLSQNYEVCFILIP
ncbi:Thyroid adenoma-associated -like protein [Babesia sp. Xinjiang]|uniref:Thyroid adenoma-associated -like protein n=1 Tax=Babesia sp. Xinjiang TaxID=462227 RepID=UPI000A2241D8|nr:Thyroid adenoma-associated -like protein [Babesia sp. Xinjiang]ORM39810.1 Thyroid adenoma-associated -like protein [Babesia sp. Xinjiang]